MATVNDALEIAHSLLNDDTRTKWSDSTFLPKIKQAHLEMVSKLALNGIPVQFEETTEPILVLAGAKDLGADQPNDILRVIRLAEMAQGDDIANMTVMTKMDFIPDYDPTDTLRFWAYNRQIITFLGATANREVEIRYICTVPTPLTVNDLLYFELSELFLGPRAAALTVLSINPSLASTLNNMADTNLSTIVRTQIKALQNLPVRRRPFSYALKSRRRFTL